MKRFLFFLLGVLASIIAPLVVEYFVPYRPGFADRNKVVRRDAGRNG